MYQEDPPSSLRRGLSLASICLLNCVGAIQITGFGLSWGTICVYLTSYLYLYDSRASLTLTSLAWNACTVPFAIGAGTLYLVTGTWLFHWIGPRATMVVGLVCTAGGVVGLSWVTSYEWFLGGMAVAMGFGPAVVSLTSIFTSWSLLPSHKGLATGLVSCSFSSGGFFYGLLFTFLVNPSNRSPDLTISVAGQTEHLFSAEVADRVPPALRWTMGVGGGVGLLATVLIGNWTSRDERRSISKSIVSKGSDTARGPHMCPSLSAAIQTSAFWVLFGVSYLSMLYPYLMFAQYKNYGEKFHSNDHVLSGIGSGGILANALSRLFASWMTEYLPYKKMTFVVCSLLCVLAATLPLIASSNYLFGLWVVLTFIGHGGLFSPCALKSGDLFGPVIGSKAFALIMQGNNLSNLTLAGGSLFAIEVRNRQYWGYTKVLWIVAGAEMVAVGLILGLKGGYRWGEDGGEEDKNKGLIREGGGGYALVGRSSVRRGGVGVSGEGGECNQTDF